MDEDYWPIGIEPELVDGGNDVAFRDSKALDFRDEDNLADQPEPVFGNLTLRDLAEPSEDCVWKGVPGSWSLPPDGFELDCPVIEGNEDEDSWLGNGDGDGAPARSGLSYPLLASTLVHVGLMFVLTVTAVAKVSGTGGERGTAMAARLIAPEEIVPQDESPASVDSIAVQSTRAKTTEKAPELPEKQLEKDALTLSDHQEKPAEPEKKLKETERGVDKKTNQGSIGSVASAERRSLASAGSDGDEFESALLSAIRQAAFFPKKAVEKGASGEVLISFALGRDGTLSAVTIARSSGDQILDEAAVKIVRSASKKFPRLPDRVAADSVGYDIPIRFREPK